MASLVTTVTNFGEMLKTWLKTSKQPTWQNIVGALKSRVVGEPRLASDIETEYCTTPKASGQTKPEEQRSQQTRGTVLLQQVLQNSQELLD